MAGRPRPRVGDVVVGSARPDRKSSVELQRVRTIARVLHELGLIPDPAQVTHYEVELLRGSMVIRARTITRTSDPQDMARIRRVLADVEELEATHR